MTKAQKAQQKKQALATHLAECSKAWVKYGDTSVVTYIRLRDESKFKFDEKVIAIDAEPETSFTPEVEAAIQLLESIGAKVTF